MKRTRITNGELTLAERAWIIIAALGLVMFSSIIWMGLT